MPYRRSGAGIEVLLAHPGGPFWARKDDGAWTIVKGELVPGEAAEAAARREFQEETGLSPNGELFPLGRIKQAGGKVVVGFATELDCDPAGIVSNAIEMEWPPHSGRRVSFPKIDRIAWFTPDIARQKINAAQVLFVDRLLQSITAYAQFLIDRDAPWNRRLLMKGAGPQRVADQVGHSLHVIRIKPASDGHVTVSPTASSLRCTS